MTPTPSSTALGSDAQSGLTDGRGRRAARRYGVNEIAAPSPRPSTWAIALLQLKDPMNLMLVAVADRES